MFLYTCIYVYIICSKDLCLGVGLGLHVTKNHGFDTPAEGTTDWHVPVNTNFEALDAAVEIRDRESRLDDYSPKAGAKFFATDTGHVYVGDGTAWSRAPVPGHDHQMLSVSESFQLPLRDATPSSPSTGEVWFRTDLGEIHVQTASGTHTLAFSSGSDSNEESTRYDVTEPFDDATWIDTFGDEWDYRLSSNASIADVKGRSGNQLQATVPGGENRGMFTIHNHATRTRNAPTKLYHKFYIRFEPGFANDVTDDGKLPGFAGRDGTDEGAGGNPANGTGWSARMAWGDPGDHGSGIALNYYIYHMDASGSYGEHDHWGRLLEEDRWYQIEQYIDLGTPDANDGVLRGWIDSNLEYDRTNLRWREDGGNDVQWSWWDFYHGGGKVPNGDVTVQFDELDVVRGGMP